MQGGANVAAVGVGRVTLSIVRSYTPDNIYLMDSPVIDGCDYAFGIRISDRSRQRLRLPFRQQKLFLI